MEKLIIFKIKAGSSLFREGDPGNFFYIVKEGILELCIEGTEEVKRFVQGDTFGELALIHKNKRSGTVKCMKDAQIFCLDGIIFRDIIQKINKVYLKDRLYFLSLVPILSNNIL